MLQTALAHYESRFTPSANSDRCLARVLASGLAPYEAILLKGNLFLDQGRYLQARHQFLRAIRSRTEDPRPWTGIARSYLASSDHDELDYAYQAAEKACRLSNYRDCDALRTLVVACRTLGKDSDVELYQAQIYELELAEELSPASIKEIERQIERLQLLG